VEAVGIEPTSESTSPEDSPSAVIVLKSRLGNRPMTGYSFGQSQLNHSKVRTSPRVVPR